MPKDFDKDNNTFFDEDAFNPEFDEDDDDEEYYDEEDDDKDEEEGIEAILNDPNHPDHDEFVAAMKDMQEMNGENSDYPRENSGMSGFFPLMMGMIGGGPISFGMPRRRENGKEFVGRLPFDEYEDYALQINSVIDDGTGYRTAAMEIYPVKKDPKTSIGDMLEFVLNHKQILNFALSLLTDFTCMDLDAIDVNLHGDQESGTAIIMAQLHYCVQYDELPRWIMDNLKYNDYITRRNSEIRTVANHHFQVTAETAKHLSDPMIKSVITVSTQSKDKLNFLKPIAVEALYKLFILPELGDSLSVFYPNSAAPFTYIANNFDNAYHIAFDTYRTDSVMTFSIIMTPSRIWNEDGNILKFNYLGAHNADIGVTAEATVDLKGVMSEAPSTILDMMRSTPYTSVVTLTQHASGCEWKSNNLYMEEESLCILCRVNMNIHHRKYWRPYNLSKCDHSNPELSSVTGDRILNFTEKRIENTYNDLIRSIWVPDTPSGYYDVPLAPHEFDHYPYQIARIFGFITFCMSKMDIPIIDNFYKTAPEIAKHFQMSSKDYIRKIKDADILPIERYRNGDYVRFVIISIFNVEEPKIKQTKMIENTSTPEGKPESKKESWFKSFLK